MVAILFRVPFCSGLTLLGLESELNGERKSLNNRVSYTWENSIFEGRVIQPMACHGLGPTANGLGFDCLWFPGNIRAVVKLVAGHESLWMVWVVVAGGSRKHTGSGSAGDRSRVTVDFLGCFCRWFIRHLWADRGAGVGPHQCVHRTGPSVPLEPQDHAPR